MSIGRWARGLAGIAFLGAIVGSTQACVEAEGELYITQALAPDATTDGTAPDACGDIYSPIITVNTGLVLDARGQTALIDRSLVPVVGFFCVRNHMRSRSDNGVETSNVILYQYDVSLSTGDSRTQATSGAVAASDADGVGAFDGSHTTVLAELMTGSQVQEAAGNISASGATEIVATVKFYGRTTGGLEVETPDYYIPVRVYDIDELCSCDGQDGVQCPESDPGCM